MKRPYYVLCLMLLLAGALCGCRGEPEIVWAEGGKGQTDAEVGQRDQSVDEMWHSLAIDPQTDPRLKPVFIPADDAEKCPALKLQTFEGETLSLNPAVKGRVVIVVFWFAEDPAARAAALHVRDLCRKYSDFGVDAVGVAERTLGYKTVPRFLQEQGIRYTTYYDDFSALRTMGSAADVKLKREAPCIFLVDREKRVRVLKRGFAYTAASSVEPRTKKNEDILENAAEGERIENYVQRLIKRE